MYTLKPNDYSKTPVTHLASKAGTGPARKRVTLPISNGHQMCY